MDINDLKYYERRFMASCAEADLDAYLREARRRGVYSLSEHCRVTRRCGLDHNENLKSLLSEGVARGLYVNSYAEWAERNQNNIVGIEVAGPGEDWMDVAPETDASARRAAADLIGQLERENQFKLDFYYLERVDDIVDDYENIENFAVSLALRALGHGVEFDYPDLIVPYFEYNQEYGWYQVMVENIGNVYQGYDEETARRVFDEYVERSQAQLGRAAGEPVFIFENYDILDSYHPGDSGRLSEA